MGESSIGTVRPGSGEMFDAIAARYDLLNRVISLGVDQSWRRRTVAALQLAPGHRVLDLATGTGDLAILVARLHADVSVVGIDPSPKMLEIGREKLDELAERIELRTGDAQRLELPTGSIDACCMAFGIRNVPDRSKALAEIARVVRPGGRVAILELSEPRSGVLGTFARWHVHHVVPFIGGLLSGSQEYRYLQRSIEAFPAPEEFAAQMEAAGLEVLEVERFTFGVCCLFVATPKGVPS